VGRILGENGKDGETSKKTGRSTLSYDDYDEMKWNELSILGP
jgi:hypothetical protein